MNNYEINDLAHNNANIALQQALILAIAETPEVHADSTNPFHKSKYASLNAHLSLVKPIFAKHGLAILQMPIGKSDAVGVSTTIIHKDGGSISTDAYIPCGQGLKAQEAGSIYSYLRRYAIAAVAGIATDDDDANVVSTTKTAVYSAPATVKKMTVNPTASTSSTGEVDFSLQVPFGKNKGSSLDSLPLNDLDYWANKWEPKPWEKTGKVGSKDLNLKSSAQALWSIKNSNSDEAEDTSEDQVPF
jgi:hypothetical protein